MRAKWVSLFLVAVLGSLLGAGARLYITVNPFAPIVNQADISKVQPVEEQDSMPAVTEPAIVEPPEEPTISITPADKGQGEIVVEGLVDSVSIRKHTLKFTQEMDDFSEKVNPRVTVLRDAIIELNGQTSEFDNIIVGDYVTMILDAKHQARAIQIER